MSVFKPLDIITAIIAVGCLLLLGFAREDAAKTAGTVLISVVSYYLGRKGRA